MGEVNATPVREVVGRLSSTSGGLYLWYDDGPVYTPPSLRGRGYASAGVASVSQLLLEEGRRWCFLLTDVANPTTQHLYEAIGYRPVCDLEAYTFDPPTDAGYGSGT